MNAVENKILAVCMTVITPLIFMFGFYIQFHGKVSPGGGFQSGIIFAIPFVVYMILYGNGTRAGKCMIDTNIFCNIACFGVLFYLGIGFITDIMGSNFLGYAILHKERRLAEQIGIFIAETGVCMTVFGAMCTIFKEMYSYINREKEASY